MPEDTALTCAQIAEPVKMPFGFWALVGSRNHVLDGGPDSAMPDDTAMSYAKIAELIEMPFGLWTRVGRWKHVLHGATWRIRLNRKHAAVLWPYVKKLNCCIL